MALTSTVNRNAYIGDGLQSVYAYVFRIIAQTDLLVVVADDATAPNETTLVLGTDYTVSGVGAETGGNVTLISGGQSWINGSGKLKLNYRFMVRRKRPLTQTSDIRNQGDFFPETHEDNFDHGIMIDQQLQESLDRSVHLPETVSAASFNPTLPTNIAANPNAALIINSAGTGLTLGASATTLLQVFNQDTYANLKTLGATTPSTQRWGWATDILQLVFYTANASVGDGGWIVVGG